MPRQRQYINVPFKEKEEAKSLGAIWDIKAKKFFVPFYLDFSLFSKWSEKKTFEINKNEALLQFKQALESFGLILDDYPIMNGLIQRCKVINDKNGEKSGAYVGYLDNYPAGFMQNFKTNLKQNWKFQSKNTSYNFQKSLSNSNLENTKKQKAQELLALQEKTALRLEKEWNEAKKALNSHPYLKAKGLKSAYDLKIDKFNNLLIPLKDINEKFWSLQRISQKGRKIIGVIKTKDEKQIQYSAKKKACFYTQIPLDKHDEFLICEGFATAMSLQEILKKPVIMAIDAGNLISVIETLKQKYPLKQIILYSDNDLKSKTNIGLNTAKSIKEKYNDIKVFYPNLNEYEVKENLSDFNDIFIKYGFKIKEKIKELKL